MPRTLRLRLTLLTGGVLALALAAGALVLAAVLAAGRMGDLDAAARSRVQTVADLVLTDRVPDALGVAQPGEVVQVLAVSGGVVATSANASLTLPVVDAAVLDDLVARSRSQGAGGAGGAGGVVVMSAPSAYAGEARVAALVLPDGVTVTGSDASGPLVVVAAVPSGDVAATVRAFGAAFVVAVPLLAVGAALLVWLVLGRALRGVEELRVAADAVARTGGPGSLPVPATGELAALATTLNAMLDRLDGAVLASRSAATTALAAADRQRAFVADAAHELRSPIASLVTALEVAQRHPASYPRDELVADLTGEVARMQALVDDLLLLARVGSRPLALGSVDLREIADGVVRDLAPVAGPEGAGAVPSERVPSVVVSGTGRAVGDAATATRVLRNLVANAVRHARSSVTVRVAHGRVEVVDDGAGIPEADRERVFERFVRLDEARERDAGGSGLGLAIARELAREQGGDVVLAAVGTDPGARANGGSAEGEGLRATLTLPLALPLAERDGYDPRTGRF